MAKEVMGWHIEKRSWQGGRYYDENGKETGYRYEGTGFNGALWNPEQNIEQALMCLDKSKEQIKDFWKRYWCRRKRRKGKGEASEMNDKRLDDDRLDELIEIGENGAGNFGTEYTNKYIIPALKEFKELRRENKHQHISIIENLKTITELRNQNQLLKENSKRLANGLKDMLIELEGERNTEYPIEREFLDQHKQLMEKLEEKV